MAQTTSSENQFVVDLLATLHNEKFSPMAWIHFFGRAWEMSYQTANAHPTLKRSWVRLTLFISILAIAIFVVNFILEGPVAALHLLITTLILMIIAPLAQIVMNVRTVQA